MVDKDGLEMLEAVLDLPTSKVKEVMIPRVDMACVGEEARMDEMLGILKQKQYARIPIYKDGIDDIMGILYAKDLLGYLGRDVRAKDLARPPYFVPETMSLSSLLREFRHKGVHIAVVVDEYGGTAGLVTIEDLLEEIVGEIQDEYDLGEESPYKSVGEGIYLVKAKTDITLLNEELGLNLPENDFETISGLVLERLGRIPLPGESIRFEGATLTILKADQKSISLVRVKKETMQ